MFEVTHENVETAEELAQQAAQIEAWLSFWSEVLQEKEGSYEANEQQSEASV